MQYSRRSLLSAISFLLPFGLGTGAAAAASAGGPMPRFRCFEDAVREAFQDRGPLGPVGAPDPTWPCHRIEVGYSDEVQVGVQGCHNDRPFAGFPAGHLRIVRSGSGPGRAWRGVRLYVCTVDVAWTGGRDVALPSRPLNFATLPPALVLADAE